ncbi:MAG TPA: HypC/HybG/HupF family hydrogenase formation chaperone [Candidatus Binatia bacterium]|jgi:hydrogenase expression/formation protein HypC
MCLAIPGRLVSVCGAEELRAGEVDFGGVRRPTNLAFVPEAQVGDYVLVHVGFAIAVIDEVVAAETLDALTALDVLRDDPDSLARFEASLPAMAEQPKLRRLH